MHQTPVRSPIPSSNNTLKAELCQPRVCSGIPFVVSLSLTRKVPLGFSALSSRRSDSRLVILPKYHLGRERQDCVCRPGFTAHSAGPGYWRLRVATLLPTQAHEGQWQRTRSRTTYSLLSLDGVGGRHIVAGDVTGLSRAQRVCQPPVSLSEQEGGSKE